jgi:hypothetical protein
MQVVDRLASSVLPMDLLNGSNPVALTMRIVVLARTM